MLSFIWILFILSAVFDQISCPMVKKKIIKGRRVGATVGDNLVYGACGRLCDKPDITSIAPLNVETDKQFLVLIIRDVLCSYLLDIKLPQQNRDLGRKHHFKYDYVEALYTIFDNPKSSDKFNTTALFTSGMTSDVWRSVGGIINRASAASLPLMGLNHNMQSRIDAAFGWQPDPQSKIVKIIQNDSYYSYDLIKKKQLSGPDSITKDFGYDYKKFGKIVGAFARGNDLYLFNDKGFYFIWKSKDGKTGALSQKYSITKDFFKCDTKYTTTGGSVTTVGVRNFNIDLEGLQKEPKDKGKPSGDNIAPTKSDNYEYEDLQSSDKTIRKSSNGQSPEEYDDSDVTEEYFSPQNKDQSKELNGSLVGIKYMDSGLDEEYNEGYTEKSGAQPTSDSIESEEYPDYGEEEEESTEGQTNSKITSFPSGDELKSSSVVSVPSDNKEVATNLDNEISEEDVPLQLANAETTVAPKASVSQTIGSNPTKPEGGVNDPPKGGLTRPGNETKPEEPVHTTPKGGNNGVDEVSVLSIELLLITLFVCYL